MSFKSPLKKAIYIPIKKFTIGISINKPKNPLLPKSWHRLAMFAIEIHITGKKINKVNIATPSGMLSPERFAGSKGMLTQKFVIQYLDLRFLPLNENNDFQKESLVTVEFPLGEECCGVGTGCGAGCNGLVTGEVTALSLGFDRSNFFI